MRNCASWADGFAVLAAGSGLASAALLWDKPGLQTLACLFSAFTFTAATFVTVIAYRSAAPQLYRRFVSVTKTGAPMMLIGAMSVWLGVGGRIVFGLVNTADLAIYSVAFRIAGFVLGLHQLVITAAFARLYTARTRYADKVMGFIVAAIGTVSILISLIAPYFIQNLGVAAVGHGEVTLFRGILAFACAHTMFWIAHALLQLRLNRLGLSARAALPTGVALMGGTAAIIGCGYFISNNAVFLTALISMQAVVYFVISCYILYRKNLPHYRLMLSAFIFSIILFSIGIFSSIIIA